MPVIDHTIAIAVIYLYEKLWDESLPRWKQASAIITVAENFSIPSSLDTRVSIKTMITEKSSALDIPNLE